MFIWHASRAPRDGRDGRDVRPRSCEAVERDIKWCHMYYASVIVKESHIRNNLHTHVCRVNQRKRSLHTN